MPMAITLNTTQQTTLGRQMQKALVMLQMNAQEFAQEISQALDSNPMLEVDEAADQPERVTDPTVSSEVASAAAAEESRDRGADRDWGRGTSSAAGDDSFDWLAQVPATLTLRQYLRRQIAEAELPEEARPWIEILVDSLDERGYLVEPVAELVAVFELGSEAIGPLERALASLRTFEPAGVGARDLADCLELQLDRLDDSMPYIGLARAIVREHLSMLAGQPMRNLATVLEVSTAELDGAVALIRSLTPKPGLDFDGARPDYIVPDLELVREDGRWTMRATAAARPRVNVNEAYADALAGCARRAHGELRERLREARWIVRAIEQRATTIERVGEAIASFQQGYFQHGDIALVPMTLADIAQLVDVHESTVSRVVNSKYVSTPNGLMSLKRFFVSSVSTSTGRDCSAAAVKAMIRSLVTKESPETPYSDHQLAALLKNKGIRVARRTVSKYRSAMGIESYEMRRVTAVGRSHQARFTRSDSATTPGAIVERRGGRQNRPDKPFVARQG